MIRSFLLVLSVAACSPPPDPHLDLGIVESGFSDEELADIRSAFRMWNDSMDAEVVWEWPNGEHWIFAHCDATKVGAGVYRADIGLCLESIHGIYEPAGVNLPTAVAHEIGHLLLGEAAANHLPSGLMHWEAEHRSWSAVDPLACSLACEQWSCGKNACGGAS